VYYQGRQIIGGTLGSLLFFRAHLAGITYIADAISYLPMIVLLGCLQPKMILLNALTKTMRKEARSTLKEACTFLWQTAMLKRVFVLRMILVLGTSGGYVSQRMLASDVFGGLQAYIWFAIVNSVGGMVGSSIAARLLKERKTSVHGVLAGAIMRYYSQQRSDSHTASH
jgi:hypothetical protein